MSGQYCAMGDELADPVSKFIIIIEYDCTVGAFDTSEAVEIVVLVGCGSSENYRRVINSQNGKKDNPFY
jgi:hypothetical protein